MKKTFLGILITTLLLPSAAFSESCLSLLRGKNLDREELPRNIYIAWGTHDWTKETNWDKCIYIERESDSLVKKYNCGGRKYLVNTLSRRMWVTDKSERNWELEYKGSWQDGSFPCEVLGENSFQDGETTYRRAIVGGAGVMIILRMDDFYKYSTFEPNF